MYKIDIKLQSEWLYIQCLHVQQQLHDKKKNKAP